MRTAQLNTLFLDYKEGLHAYLIGFLKNKEDAQDVLQDLYLKVWGKRKTIKEDTAKYYFYSTARNLCIDHFRKKKRGFEPEFSLAYENSAHQDYEKKELSRLFRSVVAKLPSGYREVIFLTDICQMTSDDVIRLTNSNANAMRVNLSRARAKVREELEKLYSFQVTSD